MQQPVIFDGRNLYELGAMRQLGLHLLRRRPAGGARRTEHGPHRHHRRRRVHRLASRRPPARRRARGHRARQPLDRPPRNIAHLLGNQRFHFIQLRRHRLHLRRRAGRRDLPPRLAAEPGRLPAEADPDPEGRRARHAQDARPGARARARASCSPRPPRSTAIRRCTRSRRPTGATSTRSARAACTTSRSASPKR